MVAYAPVEMEVLLFDSEDVIITSNDGNIDLPDTP